MLMPKRRGLRGVLRLCVTYIFRAILVDAYATGLLQEALTYANAKLESYTDKIHGRSNKRWLLISVKLRGPVLEAVA